jgi:hypothetical protein
VYDPLKIKSKATFLSSLYPFHVFISFHPLSFTASLSLSLFNSPYPSYDVLGSPWPQMELDIMYM